jgi:glycosyltransferase involved in cell wall biosynthesis
MKLFSMAVSGKFEAKMESAKVQISVVIITYNEERNIGRCIDSILSVADEIVVVDSFSKDNTKKIAEAKGARVFEHPFKSHIHQKNVALSYASYDHVLSLDADEYLSEDLAKSILHVKNNWSQDAYVMNRLSNWGGRWIKHGNWYPDQKIRLWDKRIGKWGGENPHDKVVLQKGIKPAHLKGNLLHRGYQDTNEALAKIQRYSDIFANENVGKKKSSIFKVLIHPTFAFVKCYFLKRGFLDGFEGLMVAVSVSNHAFYKYSKLYEANCRNRLGAHVIINGGETRTSAYLALPLLSFLRSRIPHLQITYVGGEASRDTILQAGLADNFVTKSDLISGKDSFARYRANSIIFAVSDPQLARLAKYDRIKVRVGEGYRWYNWIYCNKLVNLNRWRSASKSQITLRLLRPFGLSPDLPL